MPLSILFLSLMSFVLGLGFYCSKCTHQSLPLVYKFLIDFFISQFKAPNHRGLKDKENLQRETDKPTHLEDLVYIRNTETQPGKLKRERSGDLNN